jgi:hypothetical protein
LISAIDLKEEKKIPKDELKAKMSKFKWEQMYDDDNIPLYKIFERPHLQKFLNWLFENFTVSVWTAASKTYALFIIEKFILANYPKRKFLITVENQKDNVKNKKDWKC